MTTQVSASRPTEPELARVQMRLREFSARLRHLDGELRDWAEEELRRLGHRLSEGAGIVNGGLTDLLQRLSAELSLLEARVAEDAAHTREEFAAALLAEWRAVAVLLDRTGSTTAEGEPMSLRQEDLVRQERLLRSALQRVGDLVPDGWSELRREMRGLLTEPGRSPRTAPPERSASTAPLLRRHTDLRRALKPVAELGGEAARLSREDMRARLSDVITFLAGELLSQLRAEAPLLERAVISGPAAGMLAYLRAAIIDRIDVLVAEWRRPKAGGSAAAQVTPALHAVAALSNAYLGMVDTTVLPLLDGHVSAGEIAAVTVSAQPRERLSEGGGHGAQRAPAGQG